MAGNLAGAYTIQVTNGGATCTRPMNGSAILSQISLPTVYNLSASTLGYCTGGSGVTLTLSGSQIGVDYVLLKNGISVSTISGTGAAIIPYNKIRHSFCAFIANHLTHENAHRFVSFYAIA